MEYYDEIPQEMNKQIWRELWAMILKHRDNPNRLRVAFIAGRKFWHPHEIPFPNLEEE